MEEFFEKNGKAYIHANKWDIEYNFTVEELYQAFKERFERELAEKLTNTNKE